jgi:hypothetical protein
MPVIINTPPTMRPRLVTGVMSPKPTVVMVTSDHQMPSPMSLMLGLARTSTKNKLTPPSTMAVPSIEKAKAKSNEFSSKVRKMKANGFEYLKNLAVRSRRRIRKARRPRMAGTSASTVKMSTNIKGVKQ